MNTNAAKASNMVDINDRDVIDAAARRHLKSLNLPCPPWHGTDPATEMEACRELHAYRERRGYFDLRPGEIRAVEERQPETTNGVDEIETYAKAALDAATDGYRAAFNQATLPDNPAMTALRAVDAALKLDANKTNLLFNTVSAEAYRRATAGAFTQASRIAPRAVRWIWPEWIARGCLHLIAGSPGVGKSTICFDLAARISNGKAWPDLAPNGETYHVVYYTSEDDRETVVVPILGMLGANLDHATISTPDSGLGHYERNIIADTAKRGNGRVVVFLDPIIDIAIHNGAKSGSNEDVRAALAPWQDICRNTGATIIGVTHYAKGTADSAALERVLGAGAWAGVSRVVFTAQEDDTEDRLFTCIKNRFRGTHEKAAFRYRIERQSYQFPDNGDVTELGLIHWGKPVDGDGAQLAEQAAHAKRDAPVQNEAENWLCSRLDIGESVPLATLRKEVTDNAEFSGKTFQRMLRKLCEPGDPLDVRLTIPKPMAGMVETTASMLGLTVEELAIWCLSLAGFAYTPDGEYQADQATREIHRGIAKLKLVPRC